MVQEPRVKQPDEMFCANCGTLIKAASEFCSQCGAPVAGQRRPDEHGAQPQPVSAPPIPVIGLSRAEMRRQGRYFRAYPTWLMVLFSFVTFGVYTIFWLNHWHGLMPKRRTDDWSTARAIWCQFIPIYSLYWIFESHLRLCTRLDEELADVGLSERVPKELVRWFCILSLVPYINLVTNPILGAIATGMMQSLVNQLARFDASAMEVDRQH